MRITADSLAQVAAKASWCLACDRRVERMDAFYSGGTDEFIVTARCHGSKAEFRTDALNYGGGWIGKTGDWASALFAEDASPDMQELLRYNREPSWLAS